MSDQMKGGLHGFASRDIDAANPAHYRSGAVETIDKIRASLAHLAGEVLSEPDVLGLEADPVKVLADLLFAAYCEGNRQKYVDRAGKKPGSTRTSDGAKAEWYTQMSRHALDARVPDPRARRVAVRTTASLTGWLWSIEREEEL